MLWNPHKIQVNRSNRQRREIDTDEILESIKAHGQLNPIIVSHDGNCGKANKIIIQDPLTKANIISPCTCETPILIAGERRLETCKKLNIDVEIKFRENLTNLESQVIEYEENRKRKPLHWRDEITTIVKIHQDLLESNPEHLVKDTAEKLGISIPTVHSCLKIHPHLSSPMLQEANSINQADEIVKTFFKQKLGNISQDFSDKAKAIFSKPLPDYLKTNPNTLKRPLGNLNLDIQSPEEIILEEEAEPVKNINFETWLKHNPETFFDIIHLDLTKNNNKDFLRVYDQFYHKAQAILIWFDNYQLEYINLKLKSSFLYLEPPLIWYKSDNKTSYNSYETALILYKKDFLVHLKPNLFPWPGTASTSKPYSVLTYFLSFLIEKGSPYSFFDPFVKNGQSLKAARDLGIETIFGLETDEKLYQEANDVLLRRK